VNFQPNQAQCYVRLPHSTLAGRSHDLIDLLGPARYRREGDDLTGHGLYLDLPPWGFHLFSLEAAHGADAVVQAAHREVGDEHHAV